MVTTEELLKCSQFSARDSRDSNQMALQLEQNRSLPHLIPSTLTENLALDSQPVIGVSDKPIDASCANRKRFLIFDRCGTNTRLFVSPSFSRQDNNFNSKIATASGLCKTVVEEKWDENSLNDGEGEMVENSEEIDALLYSDSDDDYDYDDDDEANDGGNYEVTSTRHTLLSIEDCINNKEQEVMEEVASSDGSPKRRKMLDGSCKKSSLASLDKWASSCNNGGDEIDSSRNENKVKINEAVKIIGSIIPGLSTNDPLSIIEEAILYLETMKAEAKELGLE